MLCYRCGSHVPDGSEACGACGQKFSSGNLRQATGTFSRKKLGGVSVDGAPFKPGDLLENRYLIKDVIGAGPLGFVFKAQDKEIDVELALKAVSAKLVQTSDERKTFAREVRLARKLSHNNIVRVYEDGEAQDRPFYTMQFLDGLTLRRIVDLRREKNQNFSLKEIEPIFGQIAAGLDSAHKVGPHTNVKPENVIVLPDLLKLTDFGLGMAVPRQPFAIAQRARGGHRYLAPEYVAGHDVDGRADVYAMGVILGEMVAGVFPEGGSVPELRSRNPELSPAVEALYRKATNENPLARHGTPGEFFAELVEIAAASEPKGARRPPAPPPRQEPPVERAAPARRPAPPPPPVEAARPPPARRAPPPPPVADEPAFTRPPSAHQNAQSDLTPVVPPPPSARSSRRPKKKGGSARLMALAIVGIVAGGGGAWGVLNFMKKPAAVDQQGDSKPPVAVVDAGTPAVKPVSDVPKPKDDGLDEQARKAEEARKLAAAKAEEERKLAAAKAEQERKLAEAKAEEERKRKEALEKAFTADNGKDEGSKDEPSGKLGCPGGMRLIAAGAFRMGTARDDPMMGFDEKPLSTVNLKAYCIDYFEYPNHKGSPPVVNVSYSAAESACRQRGKRLCTEEEWERACKGPGNLRFPYGNGFDAEACNTEDANGEDRAVASTGTFARCRSGYGIADMAGNVAEWTSSKYNDELSDRTLKGGAADRPDYATRCASRKNGPPSARSDKIGFRCCADPK